jgi:general secretion pathway protein M
MMGGVKALWAARTPRERWLVGIMLTLLAAMLAWLLVLRPMGDMLAGAKERHARSLEALAEARADAEAIRGLEKRPAPPPGAPLDALVGRAAADAGFSLARLEAQGEGRVAIVIDAARPQTLFAWVSDLEARRGLLVERLTATANGDRTVSAQIIFRARGA